METTNRLRRAFCRWYITLGNPTEAARMAGIPPEQARDEGRRLLDSGTCRRILAEFAEKPPLALQALCTAGLARLAFGAANDAVRLAYSEELAPAELETLDLFHISELKRVKGGVEIKLFDRQKALEKLLECAAAENSGAAAEALLRAIGGEVDEGGSLFAEAENGTPVVDDAGNTEP